MATAAEPAATHAADAPSARDGDIDACVRVLEAATRDVTSPRLARVRRAACELSQIVDAQTRARLRAQRKKLRRAEDDVTARRTGLRAGRTARRAALSASAEGRSMVAALSSDFAVTHAHLLTSGPLAIAAAVRGPDDEDDKLRVPSDALPDALPEDARFATPRRCYVCKDAFSVVHRFYDQLCAACGDANHERRVDAGVDMAGRVALVTGARVKIGHRIALKLLRAGATVVATSRFPADCARRFASAADSADWTGRLRVVGLDLQNFSALCALVRFVEGEFDRLDVLVNNAAQTVRRPPQFYAHLEAGEHSPLGIGNAAPPVVLSQPALSDDVADEPPQICGGEAASTTPDALGALLFPAGALDEHGQQVDLRRATSWTTVLEDVPDAEMAEAMVVNALAPTLLVSKLKRVMAATPGVKFVVNVSAMEGCFSRVVKSSGHPHTNMAKAALNMMTRTSAQDYVRSDIFMTAVDTGWVTDEAPVGSRNGAEFHPPIDEEDGAARVLHPVFAGYRAAEAAAARGGTRRTLRFRQQRSNEGSDLFFGVFLKDYAPTAW